MSEVGYLNTGYGETNILAPNNVFGRHGSIFYNKTDQAFGVAMTGMGFLFLSVPAMLGLLTAGLLAASPLIVLNSLYLYVALTTAYARLTGKRSSYASYVGEARENYRLAGKDEKPILEPLLKGVEYNFTRGHNEGVRQRANKIEQIVTMLESDRAGTVDDSDLHTADEFIKQYNSMKRLTV